MWFLDIMFHNLVWKEEVMHCNTLHEIARNMTFKGFLLQTSSAASNTYDVGCFTGTPFHCLTCFLLFEAIFCLIHTSRLAFPSLSILSFNTTISCFAQICMRVKTKIGTTSHFTTLISLLYTNLGIFIIPPISYLGSWYIFISTLRLNS